MYGTIFDAPVLVVDGKVIIALPKPSELNAAPRIKSTWPPKPEIKRLATESETTWKSKSKTFLLLQTPKHFLKVF